MHLPVLRKLLVWGTYRLIDFRCKYGTRHFKYRNVKKYIEKYEQFAYIVVKTFGNDLSIDDTESPG